jgi:WD40 repeat protein
VEQERSFELSTERFSLCTDDRLTLMTSAAKLQPIQGLRSTLSSNKIDRLSTCSHVGAFFIFVSESSQLFTYNLETRAFSFLRPPSKSKSFSQINCVDISDNLQYAATGHDDGSVGIWDLSTNSHLTTTQKSPHQGPITRIIFSSFPNVVFASDCMGVTTRIEYSKSLWGWSTNEIIIYQVANPIQGLLAARHSPPFLMGIIILPASYTIFDPSCSSTRQTIILFESRFFDNPPTLALVERSH